MVIPIRSSRNESDSELIERALVGDETAFAALYRQHADYVAGVVYRLLGRDHELDDVVQETFSVAFGQLSQLRERDKLRAFLVTVASRRVHARLGVRQRMRSILVELTRSEPRASNPAELDGLRSLYAVLERARSTHRIAWQLHRVEGYTLTEVAAMCEVSLATVKRWIAGVDQRVEGCNVAR